MTTSSIPHFDIQQMEARYQQLLDAPPSLDTLETWIQSWSNLEQQLRETINDAYFRKAQNVREQDAEQFYAFLQEQAVPKAKLYAAQLAERLLDLNPQDLKYRQMLKVFLQDRQIRTPRLIGLQAEIEVQAVTYDDITGKMLAEVDGVQMPGDDAWNLVFDTDRATREKGWRAYNTMWKNHKQELGELLIEVVKKRRHIAAEGGFADYRAYCWTELNRTDYAPQDTLLLHQGILKHLVPLAAEVHRKQAERLGLDALKPWDVVVEHGEPLKPFQTAPELLDLTSKVLGSVSADWQALFRDFAIQRPDLIDIETRADKATGGFCEFLHVQKFPHIFMSLVGRHDDMTGFFHETGHALHFLLTDRSTDLYWHQQVPMEFNETIAMTMELLPLEHLQEAGVYNENQLSSAIQTTLEQSVQLLPRLVIYDAFQHWLYTEAPEDLTIQDLDAKWLSLWHTYLPSVDDSDLEEFSAQGWVRVVHIYLYPFYMIEYVMAQVYAWQVWSAYQQNPEQTVQQLTRAMQLGGTTSLPELIQTIGQSFPVDEGQLAGAIENVRQKIFS
ncbi:M3 family metallopeptidase [Deinococcus roseus]|uniref:Oligoendopeptidase F n=1 Tax=Deinococcus roseus TaxID=392414 RepID=A0ABQ2CUI5_9DEIO|nr:M3 family metallopeptidase [Deinococcus roseus]GGJ21864.1 oligoendopeptidase F [Deinococcus roseus]